MLDTFVFAHCMTEDVRLYDLNSEHSLSTNYSDVFERRVECDVSKVEKVWTAPSIDYAVDTFRSKVYVILLWLNWALLFYVFVGSTDDVADDLNCPETIASGGDFVCSIGQGE